jgi:hypothetical protein
MLPGSVVSAGAWVAVIPWLFSSQGRDASCCTHVGRQRAQARAPKASGCRWALWQRLLRSQCRWAGVASSPRERNCISPSVYLDSKHHPTQQYATKKTGDNAHGQPSPREWVHAR